jgi:hypothetical protein
MLPEQPNIGFGGVGHHTSGAKMATSDGTLLCIFSGSNCIIVDDFNQQVLRQLPITAIWPGLPAGMTSDLDAVCRDDLNSQFIFFKGQQCAANNFKANRWASGTFNEFFDMFNSTGFDRVCGSFENANKKPYSFRLHGYSGGSLEYSAGTPVDLTIPKQMNLGGPTPLNQEGEWSQMDPSRLGSRYTEAAASHVFWPSAMGGTGQLTPALLVKDSHASANDSIYNCTFINSTAFTPLPQMWHGWDSSWEVDAATRVDTSMLPAVPSPGPVGSPNTICCELSNIMKSVCSLTVLMHKAIDACYPQSQWPTQPYPDGCSPWGQSKNQGCGCGCQDSQPNGNTRSN